MARVYNFSAGPAVLPEEVLKEAAATGNFEPNGHQLLARLTGQ